jgi:3-oxosteroid 1-dehydrogenase
VVVGAGAAGYAAAISAASAGCEVLMLEKSAQSGGTARRIQNRAQIWVPNNSFMRRKNMPDPRDMALKYMAKLAQPSRYVPDHSTLGLSNADYNLIAAFYDQGGDAIDGLIAAGGIDMLHDIEQPDYRGELLENKAPYGRCLCPRAVSKPGTEFGNGDELIDQLHAGAMRLKVQLLMEHSVERCFIDEKGSVGGVVVRSHSGTLRVRARKGVFFGTGGFLHNPDLCADFLGRPIFGGCAVSSNTGDFVRIGAAAGAELGNMTQAWWSEVVLEQALENRSVPSTIWMPGGDAMVLVNRHGRRVVNEKMTYNERGQIHYDWDASAGEYPNLLLICVFDDEVAQSPAKSSSDPMRLPVPLPGEHPPWLISGVTWEDLTTNIRERLHSLRDHIGSFQLADDFASNLSQTVERFNEFAMQGRDLDFHRGENAVQQHWGGTTRGHSANPTMFPFSQTGPYHAVILAGGAIDTKGGPKIDSVGRVMHSNGMPIAGLYGAGNCIASPAGHAYWGPGGTLGPALVFGYLAGRAAASDARPTERPRGHFVQ